MSIRDPYTKLVLVAAIFIFVCAILAAAAFAATPAFTAHKNGTNQTVVNDADTLLTWSTEGFDTNNNFATNRFTPTVAGKYLIVVSVHCQQAGYCMPAIRKNGTTIIARAQVMERTVGQTPSVTAIVDMNGSTDYVEAMATSSGTVIAGTIERTYFSGSQIDGSGGGGSGSGGNTIVTGWPDAIVCTGSGGTFTLDYMWSSTSNSKHYYHLRGDQGGGSAAPRLVFTSAGAYDSGETDFASGGWTNWATNCVGKSISQLYSGGQAFNFVGGASAAAAGSAGQVQFNEGGNLQADAGLHWDNTNKRLGIGTTTPTRALTVQSSITGPEVLLDGGSNARGSSIQFNQIGNTVGIIGVSAEVEADTSSDFALWGSAGSGLRFYTNGGATERMVIDTAGNVGIGHAAPGTNRLYVQADGSNTSIHGYNTGNNYGVRAYSAGAPALYAHTGSTAVGAVAGYSQDGLTYGMNGYANAYGLYGYYNSAGAGGIGVYARTPKSNAYAFLGYNDSAAYYCYIGYGNSYSIACSGPTSGISDERLKKDIVPLSDQEGLAALMKITPVHYHWKNPKATNREMGFLAQDVEEVLPELVGRMDRADPIDPQSLKDIRVLQYDRLAAPIVKAIQELKAANDNLKADNDSLRAELRETIESQDAEIDVLRRQVEALRSAQ